MANKFYATTAIPYVNAAPHIGHALEFVQTDVFVRYHKLKGDDALLLSGADENALKNVNAAKNEGITVQELVDKNARLFKDFAEKLFIEVGAFDRGSDKKTHWPGVEELWHRAEENGDIYKKEYKGLYCVGHEAFLTPKELTEDGLCPDHKTKPDIVEEKNYFFKLSKYQDQLRKLIDSDEYKIVPKSRKNEVLSFIDQGLEDFSISRSKERAKGWGIPVPGDDNQVIYVWFDALGIYITGIGFGTDEKNFSKWWPAEMHVIGKDIIRFHAIYWPAMLLSAGLKLPKSLFVHGFVNSGGQKMSKTTGNVIDPMEYLEKYGVDALRYYLLAEIPTTKDGDFTHEQFVRRYNGDLANGLGNVTARILSVVDGEDFSDETLTSEDLAESKHFKEIWNKYEESFANHDLRVAIETVWGLIHWLDEYIEKKKPWENKDREVLYTLLVGLSNISWLLRPFLPEAAEKIANGLGIAGKETWSFEPKKIEPLFPKIEE